MSVFSFVYDLRSKKIPSNMKGLNDSRLSNDEIKKSLREKIIIFL